MTTTGRLDSQSPLGLRTLWLTSAMVTVGILPGFLLAALAALVRQDIPFTESQLGFGVACGFTASALLSAPAGRATSRVGAQMGFAAASGGVATGLTIITFAHSWPHLVIGLVVAGCGNAFMQVSANLRIARGVVQARQGMAFGVKQSAIPGATMVAGLAVPALGVTLGWRPTVATAASVAAAIMVCQLLGRRDRLRRNGVRTTAQPMPVRLVRPVRLFTWGVACAAASATSLATFLSEFVVSTGWTPSSAGFLLAAGSAACVASRVSFGWRIDARPTEGFRWMVMQLGVGAVGLVVLALSVGSVVTMVMAVMFAFAAGWGWSGLFVFSIVREAPQAPATVTGRTQAGIFAGGAAGPLLFGLLAAWISYQVAWIAAGACLAVGGVLVARGLHTLTHAPSSVGNTSITRT